MKRKAVSGIMVTLVLIGMLALTFDIQSVKASGTIYIRADGSIDPATAPIQRDGDIYTFTGNIDETIEVQRDNIVINGKGYTLQRTGELYGFHLNDRDGVTIKNTNIMGFDHGIGLSRSRDNIISGNNITNNYNGIYMTLFSLRNTVKDNNISNNDNFGISIIGDSIENVIYHNNFIDNTLQQADTQFTASGAWDNGAEGNYWSDYTGVDSDGDGIGDTPYMIEEGSQDRYPLMNLWTPGEEEPPPTGEEEPPPFWMEWWFLTIIAVGIIVLVGAIYFLKKKKR